LIFAVYFIPVNITFVQKITMLAPLVDMADCEMRTIEIENVLEIFHVTGCFFDSRLF